MSVDPAAVVSAAGGAASAEALVSAELNALAADAQALAQQVAVGDIVTATVLPSNGLSDLLNILGNRVAASLPPTLTPGDTITAQVTGFNGTQIMLQVLSSSETAVPADTPVPTPASGTPAPPPPTTTPGVPPVPPAATGRATPIAPPVAAFVAASVRPNAPAPPPIPPGTNAPEPELTPGVPGTIPGAPGTTLAPAALGGIEARLAAARAASVAILVPPAAGRTPVALPPGPAALRPPPPPGPPIPSGAAAPPRAFNLPPPIAASRYAGLPADAPTPAGSGAAPPARGVASYADPLALVRALRLPVTPGNLAAAKLALDAPQRLPAALATLESALPEATDPRVTTLRTIAAFVGKIEPASPQLATQLEAYVQHVVSGTEPTLVDLLAAHAAATAPASAAVTAQVVAQAAEAALAPAADVLAAPAAATATTAGATTAAAAAAPAAAETPPATVPVVALAQIAERAATLAAGLKSQLFSLVTGAAPAGRGGEAVVPAATAALTAITSVQMVAAQALVATPQTMSFAIPLWLGAGYAQAQIAVDRDAPDAPNVPLDGDNFHIAFVLDTKHLGTVAIDLRTVGRAFSLKVQTENLRSAQRFGDELSRLSDRLSSLHYSPKSIEAVVAAPLAATPAASTLAAERMSGEPTPAVNEDA
jgi:hypothetical protein